MTEYVLTIENLEAGYVKGMPILKGVNLKLEKGTIAAIIGPNGAGKSTLIKAIAGLVPVSGGMIKLGGRGIVGISPHELSRHAISYVPQSDNIFRTLSIRENLELVLRTAKIDKVARIRELFEQFPILQEKQKEKAGSLSGGQRQILAVAMALSTNPKIILMDEPSAGLSPKATQEVLELARDITKEGVSILLVEQNVKQALRLSDHCYILAEGRNQLDGDAQAMLNDPVVGQIYLGGKRVETS